MREHFFFFTFGHKCFIANIRKFSGEKACFLLKVTIFCKKLKNHLQKQLFCDIM